MSAEQKEIKSETSTAKQHKGRRSADAPTFPRNPLSKVIEVATSIERNNAGRPYDRLSLAKSLDWSPNSSGFRMTITSGSRYGVTEGGVHADKISLTELGSSIVAPTSEEQKKKGLRQALMNPELFARILEFYNKKQIPREELFKNALKKEFKVVPEDVDYCYKIIMQNMVDYNIIDDIKGNKFLNLDKLGEEAKFEEMETSSDISESETQEDVDTSLNEEQSKPEPEKPKQIFVAHGKNTKPLEQLKGILDQFKVPYKIAIDEANQGRPISQKVSELMCECSSAIFIFTKDEETKDADGNTVYRPSDNVVFELGAASALYGNKIVIFKEDDVSFGSDFKDLGYISFDTDQLGAKTVELMKELIGFGLLKISAA